MGNCCRFNPPYYHDDFNSDDIKKLKMSKEINRILDNMESNKNFKIKTGQIPKKNLKDNYTVIKMIGSGLFSKVYLVKDDRQNLFAMKVIEKSSFKARDHIQKILIEKEIMKNMNHRNILRLYKTFQTEKNVYFILEYAAKGEILPLYKRDTRISD